MKTYYYNGKGVLDLPNLISISFSISGWVIEKFGVSRIKHYPELGPTKKLHSLHTYQEITNEEYETIFRFQLSKKDPHVVMRELVALGGEDATLLCYEKPGDFCHRHIVSEWFREAGYDVEEYFIKTLAMETVDKEWEF